MLIANAPIAPSSDSNVELVLISAGVVLVTALLAFIPIQMARVRRHHYLDAITAILVVWGLVTAGSISYFVMKQMDWSAAYLQNVESGYYDPQNLSDKPAAPAALWGGLSLIYLITALWAAKPRRQDIRG